MFVFGGKDDSSEKLNDLWCFNIADQYWVEVKYSQYSTIPCARSGHTTEIYRGYLVLFGGIHDVTKELNDLQLFNFKTNEWLICQDDASPKRSLFSGDHGREPDSVFKQLTLGTKMNSIRKGYRDHESPANHSTDSPFLRQQSLTKTRKSAQKKQHGVLKFHNTLTQLQKTYSLSYNKQVRLESPTSSRMQDSFVIQNHNNANFEAYYRGMKRRQQSHGRGNIEVTSIGKRSELLYGKLQGRRPTARDGHTGIIIEDMMIVFGGDRHHMPFNDTFMLDIGAEFDGRGL